MLEEFADGLGVLNDICVKKRSKNESIFSPLNKGQLGLGEKMRSLVQGRKIKLL